MSNPHTGSSFDDFLAEDGILEECHANALKFMLTCELEKKMQEQRLNVTLTEAHS
jgi:antitoxin HicB